MADPKIEAIARGFADAFKPESGVGWEMLTRSAEQAEEHLKAAGFVIVPMSKEMNDRVLRHRISELEATIEAAARSLAGRQSDDPS